MIDDAQEDGLQHSASDMDDFEDDVDNSRRGSPQPPTGGRRGSSRSSRASDSSEQGGAIMYTSTTPRGSNTGGGMGPALRNLGAMQNGGSNLSRLSNQSSMARPYRESGSQSGHNGGGNTKRESEYNVVEPDTYDQVPHLDDLAVLEILGLLKVKTSMLALGACERVKRIARAYPLEVIGSPILAELLTIVKDGPTTALAGAAMGALSTMALAPEGRQRICLLGGAAPLIKLVSKAEVSKQNTDKAVGLLMNLAADQQNRRIIRADGGIEALVAVFDACGGSDQQVLEHAMGALHNTMLADPKCKVRAVKAGLLVPLMRVVHGKAFGDDTSSVMLRARLLMGELVKVPGLDVAMAAEAEQYSPRA